ncbi:acylphosphatase [Saccharicrinis sp. FJH62]|uniref:acylphosphatase n=1 Tax=Saccharicrinis sp. FJH62 TaxID=3344657 RepID=UPI0035D41995
MLKHFNITVYGNVQGVGFRWHTRRMAETLGVTGYVKNRYNGTVYIEAEGSEIQLSQFVSWCKKGPDHAQVEHVDITITDLVGFNSFTVRR